MLSHKGYHEPPEGQGDGFHMDLKTDLLTKNKIMNILTSYQHPPYALERKLIANIKRMDEEDSVKTLRQLNRHERACLADSQLRSTKDSLIGSCVLFTRAIIEEGVDSESAFGLSDACIRKIEKFGTVSQTEQFEYEMLQRFIGLLRENEYHEYSPVVSRAITYIKQNVQHKLTLQGIANTINIHPNYLSSVFRKEVGMSIKSFIEQQKSEAIRTLLLETSLSLTDIAFTFEFSSIAYFSGFFKKHFGVSPMKYRRQHGIKG